MTTAHRPTFHPARGGESKGENDLSKLSKQYSSWDMPSHTKIKYRQFGQGTEDELKKKDFRRELEEMERGAMREKRGRDRESAGSTSSLGSSSAKKQRLDDLAQGQAAVDADEPAEEGGSSSDESSDEDEDTAALMAELEKIKKERQAEKQAKDEANKREEERIRMANILSGNPLLNLGATSSEGEFKVKRRWDDDVVFKNCAKGLDERKKETTFINDAIRSEFHRKFMDKYIK